MALMELPHIHNVALEKSYEIIELNGTIDMAGNSMCWLYNQ